MASAKVKAQTLIDENGALVFSKSYCPYCKASKSLLNELGANFKVLELDLIGMRPTTPSSRHNAVWL
jgi:glutaredoxin 3